MVPILLFDSVFVFSRVSCGDQRAVARALLPTGANTRLVTSLSHSSFTSADNLEIHGFAGYFYLEF